MTNFSNICLAANIVRHALRYLLWRLLNRDGHRRGRIDVPGGHLSFDCYGQGSPVILLHGGLSQPVSWFCQVPVLVAQGWQVILPVTRGHGTSRIRHGVADYWVYADDVKQLCDHLGLGTIPVVGWSDGGNTGLHFALRYPEQLERLVLISANYHFQGIDMTDVAGPAEALWRSWIHRLWLRLWLGNGPAGKELIDNVQRLWATQPELDAEQLRSIGHPVLSIIGSQDCVSITHNQSLTDLLPNAKPIIVGDAGHSTPITHAAEINRLIMTFLALSSEHKSE